MLLTQPPKKGSMAGWSPLAALVLSYREKFFFQFPIKDFQVENRSPGILQAHARLFLPSFNAHWLFCYQVVGVVRMQNCVKLQAANTREGTGSHQLFIPYSATGYKHFRELRVLGVGSNRHQNHCHSQSQESAKKSYLSIHSLWGLAGLI